MSIHTRDGVAVLGVADTGIGIPPDQLPHVFERFYRGDPAPDACGGGRRWSGVSSEGTGLGLAIAQWIVHEHDGTIHVDSQPGVGTTIYVQLPRAAARATVIVLTGQSR